MYQTSSLKNRLKIIRDDFEVRKKYPYDTDKIAGNKVQTWNGLHETNENMAQSANVSIESPEILRSAVSRKQSSIRLNGE